MAAVQGLRPRVGYTELLQLPDDGRRYELYDGEVVVVPSPMPRHQIVADRLTTLLCDYARQTGGLALSAPLDIVFAEHDVAQPDVVFFAAGRRHLLDLDAPIRQAPDLVVEVLSPSTERRDRGRKMAMFARHGVPEYWIVECGACDGSDGHIEILTLTGDRPEVARYVLVQTALADDVVHSARLPALEFTAGPVLKV
jgi:Uma2 family endonuclease